MRVCERTGERATETGAERGVVSQSGGQAAWVRTAQK